MEDELAGQLRERGLGTPRLCDVCGRPLTGEAAAEVDISRGAAEPVEVVFVCSGCGRAIVHDELPFDAEIASGLRENDE